MLVLNNLVVINIFMMIRIKEIEIKVGRISVLVIDKVRVVI